MKIEPVEVWLEGGATRWMYTAAQVFQLERELAEAKAKIERLTKRKEQCSNGWDGALATVQRLERELAEAQAEIVRLKGEAESWEKVFDRTCELLADAKTELAEAVAKERERCAWICDALYSVDNVAQKCAAAIRKGE